MKITSNKSKSSEKKVKASKSIDDMPTEQNPRWSVEKITNGFIVDKSWTDKNGRYQNTKTYSETNPLDEKEEKEED